MTYTDYLQERELDDRLAFQITEPIKELITTSNQALNAQINILERIEVTQAQAAYEVVCAIHDLREATEEGFRRVGSILEWGFSEVIFRLGRTNDLLSDIRNLIENRSLTWAYEQFNRARDRYRRGHFLEALESVEKAISGHGTELGDKTEHRFHYLRGIIRLGSFGNNSSEVVDLPAAEQAFLLASKYAAHDFPDEAGDALMCAAHAANYQGHYSDAAKHAEKGLLFRETAGLHYEFARALLQLGRDDEAKHHLEWAIRLDKNLLIKASGDHALSVREGFLERTFEELLREGRELAQRTEECLANEIACMISTVFKSSGMGQTLTMKDGCRDTLAQAQQCAVKLAAARLNGGILELRASLEEAGQSCASISTADHDFRNYISQGLRRAAEERRNSSDRDLSERRKLREQGRVARDDLPFIIGIGVGLLYTILQLTRCDPGGPDENDAKQLGILFGAIIGGPIIGVVALGLTWIIQKAAQDSWESENQAILSGSGRILQAIGEDERIVKDRPIFTPIAKPDEVIPPWAQSAESRTESHNSTDTT